MRKPILAATALVALAGAAFAQADHSMHGGGGDESAATAAYRDANAAMHEAMDIEFTGDPDVDFLMAMIPHHQGAIDMAEVVLEYGSDPQIKALAEEIIAAQEAEIAQMRAWLEERGY